MLSALPVMAGCGGKDHADPQALKSYVERYVELLNSGDGVGLAEHLANPAQPQDAADRLARFGRRGLHDVRSSWTSEFPDVYRVTISAVDSSNATVTASETIGWEKGHGVMAPLHAQRGSGAAATSSPSSASSSP